MSLSRIMSFGQGKVTTSRRVLAHQSISPMLFISDFSIISMREKTAEGRKSTGGLAENTPLRT